MIPSLKPFLALRGMSLRCLMRPVPVVFLLIALADQLSAAKKHVAAFQMLYPIDFALSCSHVVACHRFDSLKAPHICTHESFFARQHHLHCRQELVLSFN